MDGAKERRSEERQSNRLKSDGATERQMYRVTERISMEQQSDGATERRSDGANKRRSDRKTK